MLPLIHLDALSRRLPSRAVFSGRTAAWLHGLDLTPCDPVEITLPRSATTSRRSGMSLTRSDLVEDEIAAIHGLPVTSRIRTVADVGRRLELIDGVIALDMALRRRLVSVDQLTGWMRSHPCFHGLRRLKRAIDLADGRAESPMETRLRLVLIANGLPKPSLQVPLYDATGVFVARPDLYYPACRLAVEYDGGTHRGSLAADDRRQNRLLLAGYRLLRFTAGDVLNRPASVAAQVGWALRV